MPATQACPGPNIELRRLAADLWWIPGHPGDADEANRGAISNLLALREGRRLWLLGSGPSEVYGRTLACRLRRVTGRAVSDVISPWPRPELVLGQAGVQARRHWAHAEVAQTMQERCHHCVQRLRLRLGSAASDLGRGEPSLPGRPLIGASGRLGPWHWWRLERSSGTPVTVWWLPRHRLATAHGLLWSDGAPDLRDAASAPYAEALGTLQRLEDRLRASAERPGSGVVPASSPALRWLPEQGPLLPAGAAAQQQAYVIRLRDAARAGVAAGADLPGDAPAWPGVGATADNAAGAPLGPRHALNWQRVWREAEDEALAPVPPAIPAASAPIDPAATPTTASDRP